LGRQAATNYIGQINRIAIRTQRVMYIRTQSDQFSVIYDSEPQNW